jgi:predicted GTPase
MSDSGQPTRVVIMGAAGRDFHDFNLLYRGDPRYRVVAFTAAQIPGIAGRRYPPELAGPGYPDGIPILDEADLADLCRVQSVDRVVFAYSDISHAEVMRAASRALAAGADFVLHGPRRTMLPSRLPVVSICAARTGCGKSPLTRHVADWLGRWGWRVAVVRHPMPYGDLLAQRVQRFASLADLDAARCSAEEREEFEPHVAAGRTVLAGVDYAQVLALAEAQADAIVWDGGNNDFSFFVPDLAIAVTDALRPEQAAGYHPGEAVVRRADVVVVNKVGSASKADVARLTEVVETLNPAATVVRGTLALSVDHAERLRGARVVVVEDGPTITHGGMPFGAGYVAALEGGVDAIVDPRRAAVGAIAHAYERFPHIGKVLPALGYGEAQLAELRESIEASGADLVVSATPCDLATLAGLNLPVARVRYEFEELGDSRLDAILEDLVTRTERG